MFGLLPVKGRFHEISDDGQITDPRTLFGGADIRAASLDTTLKKRHKDLRAPEFFDVAKYADISVVLTGAEAIGGDTVDLRANLTVKGTTAPIPLQAKVAVLDDRAVRLNAQTDIDRKDFGVDGNMMGMIRDAAHSRPTWCSAAPGGSALV